MKNKIIQQSDWVLTLGRRLPEWRRAAAVLQGTKWHTGRKTGGNTGVERRIISGNPLPPEIAKASLPAPLFGYWGPTSASCSRSFGTILRRTSSRSDYTFELAFLPCRIRPSRHQHFGRTPRARRQSVLFSHYPSNELDSSDACLSSCGPRVLNRPGV